MVLTAPGLPTNIMIFECNDTEGRVSGDTIFVTLIRGVWYFYDPRDGEEDVWHKPGKVGIAYIEKTLASGQAFRVSEDRFHRKTARNFLDTASDLLGLWRQRPLHYLA